MIAAAMQEEAVQRANSPEGMERLVHALLFSPTLSEVWKNEVIKSLATDLFNRIRYYVKLKRIRAIHRSRRERKVPFEHYYVDAAELHAARESYREVQEELIARVGAHEVRELKRMWGRNITLRRILFEEREGIVFKLHDFGYRSIPATEHSMVVHNFYGNTKTDTPQ